MVYNNLDFRTLRCKTDATIPKCPERLCKVRTFCLICNALLPHILQFFSVFPPFFKMPITFVYGTSHCRYLYEVLLVCSLPPHDALRFHGLPRHIASGDSLPATL